MAETLEAQGGEQTRPGQNRSRWRSFFGRNSGSTDAPVEDIEDDRGLPTKWGMGVLNDKLTHEVPGMMSFSFSS